MVTYSWLQKHDTVFLFQRFWLILDCVPQGIQCNLVICPQLPFSIFTTFWRNAVVQKAGVASPYSTKSLWRFTNSHGASVWNTVIFRRLDYRDNDRQWSFWFPSWSRNSPILGFFFCWSASALLSPLDTVIYCIEMYENYLENYREII